MVNVKVINGNIEKALQILKRKVKEDRVFIEVREREQYTKPSERKRKAGKIVSVDIEKSGDAIANQLKSDNYNED